MYNGNINREMKISKTRILQYFQYAFAAIILIYVVYFAGVDQFLKIIINVNPIYLLIAAGAYLLNNILMAVRLKHILSDIDRKIRFKFVFFAHMTGMLASDFTPARSGYIFSVYALRKYGLSVMSSLAAITSTYLFDLMFKICVAGVGIICVYTSLFEIANLQTITFLLVFVSLVWASYLILVYPPPFCVKLCHKFKITEKIIYLGVESKKVQKHLGLIITVSVMGWICKGIEWYCIALALGIVQLSFINALILNPVVSLFSFVPLTPAGLGIQEAGIVGIFALFGIAGSYAVSFSLTTRFVDVFVDLFGIRYLLTKPVQKDTLSEFYNTIEGDIDERAYNSDLLVQKYWQRRHTQYIKSSISINSEDIVLDIGCGSGVQLREIGAMKCKLAVGIDLNRNALKFAKNKSIANTDFIIADAEHLPIKTNSITKVVCSQVIEHLPNPSLLIAENNRILKTDGEIVITTPNEASFWGVYEILWDIFGRGRNYGETHLLFYSPKDMKRFFSNFSRVNVTTIFFAAPLSALLKSEKILDIFAKIDVFFEKHNLGMILIMNAKK